MRNRLSMEFLRKAVPWATSIVVLWLAVCAIAGVMSVNWALHPPRLPIAPGAESEAAAIAASDHATLEDASIVADDGAVLRAWYIHPSPGNGDAVILLHGLADNRAGTLGPAYLLLRHGYSVLLPDARAHGASGGAIATYGVEEAGDIRDWFNWLNEKQAPHCIDGLGDSMGAAQILESLKAENHFCAVVAESPFASFREASYDRIGQWLGAEPRTGLVLARTIFRPVITFGFIYARLRYGVNLERDDPAAAMATSNVSVLLIHGRLDDNLPPRHSEMILARCHGRDSRNIALWEPPDAGHIGASSAEPQEYERIVIGWLQSHQSRR